VELKSTSLRRGWRFHVVDASTRLARGDRGANFRQGVMETAEQLHDQGDLRLLDVATVLLRSLRFSSKLIRTSTVATIFAVASFFAVMNLVNIHRADAMAHNRDQLLRYLSRAPRHPIVLTSAEQGRSCLELNRTVHFTRSDEVRSNSHVVSISLEFYCYPSNLLSRK
jgi:hypothetical protein